MDTVINVKVLVIVQRKFNQVWCTHMTSEHGHWRTEKVYLEQYVLKSDVGMWCDNTRKFHYWIEVFLGYRNSEQLSYRIENDPLRAWLESSILSVHIILEQLRKVESRRAMSSNSFQEANTRQILIHFFSVLYPSDGYSYATMIHLVDYFELYDFLLVLDSPHCRVLVIWYSSIDIMLTTSRSWVRIFL